VRTIPISLLKSTAWGIYIERLDGFSFGLTTHDEDVTIGSQLYRTGPGLDVESLVSTASLGVDNTELTILADDALMTRDDIAAGRWDGAMFELFQFDWKEPTEGAFVRMSGNLGAIRPQGDAFVAELRDLRQPIQQDNTAVLQPTCRYRFCDERCTLDEEDFSHTVTVTAVASNQRFSIAPVGSPSEDGFTEGEVRWQTGQNFGIRAKVREYDEGSGEFTLATPMVFDIEVGDTAIAIEGCLKTREACKGYQNILNFGGEPDKPTVDRVVGPADYDE
jgi:uncharacterized phage protein (TIGR02218 family)